MSKVLTLKNCFAHSDIMSALVYIHTPKVSADFISYKYVVAAKLLFLKQDANNRKLPKEYSQHTVCALKKCQVSYVVTQHATFAQTNLN